MQPTIYLKGIDKLEKNVNKLIKEVTSEKTKLLLRQAKLVQARIKEKAPVGPTGNLKKSTYAVAYPEKLDSPAVAYAGIRRRKAPHAHFLEFGTVKMAPHPFIRPAWDECKEEVKNNIAKELGKTIEGAV